MSDSTLPEKVSSKADLPVNAVTGAQRLAAELKALTDSAKTEAKRLLVVAGQELIDANLAVSQAEERRDRAANEVADLQEIVGDVPWQTRVHSVASAADCNHDLYEHTRPGDRHDSEPYTSLDELFFGYTSHRKEPAAAAAPTAPSPEMLDMLGNPLRVGDLVVIGQSYTTGGDDVSLESRLIVSFGDMGDFVVANTVSWDTPDPHLVANEHTESVRSRNIMLVPAGD